MQRAEYFCKDADWSSDKFFGATPEEKEKKRAEFKAWYAAREYKRGDDAG